MCNPGRGATGLRARYRREGRDWRNNYWYSCWNWRRGWSSFATYNANTLNRAQKDMLEDGVQLEIMLVRKVVVDIVIEEVVVH